MKDTAGISTPCLPKANPFPPLVTGQRAGYLGLFAAHVSTDQWLVVSDEQARVYVGCMVGVAHSVSALVVLRQNKFLENVLQFLTALLARTVEKSPIDNALSMIVQGQPQMASLSH